MIYPLKVAVMVGIVGILNVSAQFYQSNARMNGLGATFVMDDMTDILRFPVYINQYKNAIQATFNSPIIGTKSIGDLITIGVVANRGLVLDSGFYTSGGSFLAGAIPQLPNPLQAQNVPHLLLGLDLSAAAIGLDFFYEYASSFFESETKADPKVTTKATTKIRNPGMVGSILIGPEGIPVMVKLGISFPTISGNIDDGATETEIKSDKGFFWEAGAEGTLPLADLNITAGADLNFESYAFKVGDTAEPSNSYKNTRIAFYAGIEGELFTNTKWGVVPALYLISGKRTSVGDTTTASTLIASLNAGIENAWTSVWIFDECFARGGLIFSTATPGSKVLTTTIDTKIRYQTTYQPITPTIGTGIKKKAFQLDITLNPTAWGGVCTGPSVGMVTGTFTF